MSTEQFSPLRYRGSNNRYVDIAVRGADEHLGLGVDYAVHPSGTGCFILRFVVHGNDVDPKNYKHLMYRESAKFVTEGTDPKSGEVFKGVRLNKIAIPAFAPAVKRHEINKFAEKFGIWALLEEWIAEQAKAEGFLVTVNLPQEIRQLVIGTETPEDAVKSVIEFPDLTSQEYQSHGLKQVKAPVEDPEPDTDEDDDSESDEKEWLN